MQLLRRTIYLGYYLRQQDWGRFRRFLKWAAEKAQRSPFLLVLDAIWSIYKYNISLEEYFLFRFYEASQGDRRSYAGTGYMYEYQLKMNPRDTRQVLEDKLQFLTHYAPFIRHPWVSVAEIKTDPDTAKEKLRLPSAKLVIKHSRGQCGRGVEVLDHVQDIETLVKRLDVSGNDLAEGYVDQHKALMELSPAGLNTVRIITQLNKKNEVVILGARLRITVNSVVDNLAAGNMAAPIDLESGVVNCPGVYSDITKADENKHPVTGVSIVGFRIPFWKETIAMCRAAALHDTSNRSIGWDVAITDDGPGLIEGNHDWCKLLWQLPVKKGLKPVLEGFL
jgi:hypothetical protein